MKKLLKKARFTEFGQTYKFDEVLMSQHPGKKFQQLVPAYNYNKIYDGVTQQHKKKLINAVRPYLISAFRSISKNYLNNVIVYVVNNRLQNC